MKVDVLFFSVSFSGFDRRKEKKKVGREKKRVADDDI